MTSNIRLKYIIKYSCNDFNNKYKYIYNCLRYNNKYTYNIREWFGFCRADLTYLYVYK